MSEMLTALTRIGDELAGIRTVLEMIAVGEDESPAADAPIKCTHPAEMVADFGLTNGEPDWICKQCGWRSILHGQAALT